MSTPAHAHPVQSRAQIRHNELSIMPLDSNSRSILGWCVVAVVLLATWLHGNGKGLDRTKWELEVHCKGMATLDATKLKHYMIRVIPVAELKVLNGCNTDTASKVEDKRTKLYGPPRRAILKGKKAKIVRGGVVTSRDSFSFIIGSAGLVGAFETLLQLLEVRQHTVAYSWVRIFLK